MGWEDEIKRDSSTLNLDNNGAGLRIAVFRSRARAGSWCVSILDLRTRGYLIDAAPIDGETLTDAKRGALSIATAALGDRRAMDEKMLVAIRKQMKPHGKAVGDG